MEELFTVDTASCAGKDLDGLLAEATTLVRKYILPILCAQTYLRHTGKRWTGCSVRSDPGEDLYWIEGSTPHEGCS